MKVVMIFMVASLLIGVLLGGFLISRDAVYVIGGEYKLESGQDLKGDLYALFADVSVAPGAQVEGRIYSVCSGLKLASASGEPPIVWNLFGFTIRLPRISHVMVIR